MAGSGKTTLMQRLNAYLHVQQTPYYLINLDPAVLDTPFGANIDIRDTVNYKEVMKQYNLGPNGGILTALNLFSTRFEEVLKLVEARKSSLKYVLLDTPGQIEIFTWSASGAIITESLASVLPTVILYVVDTPRSTNAVTFMSNMLYACSILYKTKLPLLLVFNKTDVTSHEFAEQWMQDLESFQEALQQEKSYMSTLATSMALMLEEFYAKLSLVGVSALTGDGMPELFAAIDACGDEFEKTYAVELEERRAELQAAEAKRQQAAAKGFAADREDNEECPSEGAGAKVVLDGRGGDLFSLGLDEDSEEEEEDTSYNAEDEDWGAQHGETSGDHEEYESLTRYLKAQREHRESSYAVGSPRPPPMPVADDAADGAWGLD